MNKTGKVLVCIVVAPVVGALVTGAIFCVGSLMYWVVGSVGDIVNLIFPDLAPFEGRAIGFFVLCFTGCALVTMMAGISKDQPR